MFDIGFSEIILIFIVALIVLGPAKLPETIKICAAWMRATKKMIHAIKEEVNKEIHDVKNIITDDEIIDQETYAKFLELEKQALLKDEAKDNTTNLSKDTDKQNNH